MERFLDLSIDLMAISDLSTEILVASRSFSRMGWQVDEVVGRRVTDLIHPEDLPRAQDELTSILDGGEAVAVTVRLCGGDGEYRWVQGNAMADLERQRIYFTAADITEHKALEEQLRERVQLEELVASVIAGLIGSDLTDHAEVADEVERALGRIASALGADGAYFLRDARRQDDAVFVEWALGRSGRRNDGRVALSPSAQAWWAQVMAGGSPAFIEDVAALGAEASDVAEVLRATGVQAIVLVPLQAQRRFSGFIGLVSATPRGFSDDVAALLRVAGESFMGALRQADSTIALLDARRELEHRNADLERSNEDLERFAYAAAHDLKAPLTRIEMALSASPNASDPGDELLGIARRGASRMRQLIEDLLSYAAVSVDSTSPPGKVDLDAVLSEVLADLAPAVEGGRIDLQRSPLPTVPGHEALLGQLFQNLIGNSVKFTREATSPVIRIDADFDDSGVTLKIVDNGIGIAADRRDEVFGVFTRLQSDERYAGSGIGLATCAKVVAHHGGRIWVEDGIDGGTAMHVWLPTIVERRHSAV